MNRKIKNIIMISIILIVGVLSFLTMIDAKNNRFSQGRNDFGGQQFGNPPDMQNDENNNFKNDMSNPPEKPENDSNINQNDSKITPPNQENKGQRENFNQDYEKINGERPDNINGMQIKSNTIATSYYILFSIEAFIVSLLFIYLCMSKFNKKTVKETISDTKKAVIYIILVILLTVGITYLQGLLTKNVFIGNSEEQFQRGTMQMPEDMNPNNKNSSNENKAEQL